MQSTDQTFEPLAQASAYIPFEARYSFQERCEKHQNQLAEFPNYIQLIIEKQPRSRLPQLEKVKYMCQGENTFLMIQRTIECKIDKAMQGKGCRKSGKSSLCLYAGRTLPNGQAKMYEIYHKYKASDGFLYLKYAEMERF